MIRQKIFDEELLAQLKNVEPDGMTVFVAADGMFRGAFYNGTRMVNQMRAQHNLGILETMILGQAMLCTALMIQTMKGREHLTFRYDTNGPAAGFSVEADSSGYVRGYIFQDKIPIDHEITNWDLTEFFGYGTVTITRDTEGQKEPHTGTTEIRFRNIAKDLAWHFAKSEQINTAFNTGIQFDKKGRVVGAGGLFMQALPAMGGISSKGAPLPNSADANSEHDELIERAERAFGSAPSLGQWFSEGGKRNMLIKNLFREFEPKIVLERDVIFDCPCSAQGFAGSIKNLGKAEVQDILENDKDPLEVSCKNCGSVYEIPKSMLM